MKTNILSIEGGKLKEIELPECFSSEIREDLVLKNLEIIKNRQPNSPSPMAGKKQSARGKIRHRRHVWQTHYGRGMSRIPRKVMWSRGTQFSWEGAEIPSAKGGIRAHPPKVLSMINSKKLNKKEKLFAIKSAISATASEKIIRKKYQSLKNENVKAIPFVVESKIATLKTKDFLESVKKILGDKIFKTVKRKKTQRAGRGKTRGRKYKKNAGVILVLGNNEKIKSGYFNSTNVKNLSVQDIAGGGIGRLVIYTENSIKDLREKFK